MEIKSDTNMNQIFTLQMLRRSYILCYKDKKQANVAWRGIRQREESSGQRKEHMAVGKELGGKRDWKTKPVWLESREGAGEKSGER